MANVNVTEYLRQVTDVQKSLYMQYAMWKTLRLREDREKSYLNAKFDAFHFEFRCENIEFSLPQGMTAPEFADLSVDEDTMWDENKKLLKEKEGRHGSTELSKMLDAQIPSTPPRLELPAELRGDIGQEPCRGNKTCMDYNDAGTKIPVMVIVAMCFAIYALASGLTLLLAVPAVYVAVIAAMYFSGKKKAEKENAAQDAIYFAWLEKKNERDEVRAKYNEQQEFAKQQWQKQRAEKKEELIALLTAEGEAMITQAQAERRRIEESIRALQDSYEQLLSMGVLHPKYQTMAACMTILDYFETGRVTELMGPNGAYNLYESELRSDLIIDRLDEINKSLNRIEKAMYTLVNAVRETNRHLDKLNKEMKTLNVTAKAQLDAQQEIARWSSVTAVCSYATAQNTEALKYIALVNG